MSFPSPSTHTKSFVKSFYAEMKILQKILATFCLALMVLLAVFNYSLYYTPTFDSYQNTRLNQDFLYQLNYLEAEIHQGAAKKMQKLYPEGFVFLNALYALSWIELLEKLEAEHELYDKAQKEILWVLKELNTVEGKRPFQHVRVPQYGVFYLAWTNYLRARYLNILSEEQRDKKLLSALSADLDHIKTTKQAQNEVFLASYFQACWPADNVVAMASMAIYDQMYPNTYQEFLRTWLAEIKTHEDSLGLIPHAWACGKGTSGENARGSSQSLILNFLPEIDASYAQKKFALYKDYFLDYRLGLAGIREYPKGTVGQGDIDSGPVIWGIGGAASIVGRRIMNVYQENEIAIDLRNSLESFGMAKEKDAKKYYLLGNLIMADAFIAWGNSLEILENQKQQKQRKWPLRTHIYSLILFLLFGWLAYRLLKSKKIKT